MNIKVHESKKMESVNTDIIDSDKAKFNFDLAKENILKLSDFVNKIHGTDIPLKLDRGSIGSGGYGYIVFMTRPFGIEIKFNTIGNTDGFIYSKDENERWKINSAEDFTDSLAEEIKAYNESH
jgi:hypothetical protein